MSLCVGSLIGSSAPGGRAERRVHNHHTGSDAVRKNVVDVLCVLIENMVKAHCLQHFETALGKLIDCHFCAPCLCIGSKAAYTGRRLQNGVCVADVGRPSGKVSNAGRRRELLKLLHFLCTDILCGQKAENTLSLFQSLNGIGSGTVVVLSHNLKEIPVDSKLHCIIGIFPVVCALCLSSAESIISNGIKLFGAERLSGSEMLCEYPVRSLYGRSIAGNSTLRHLRFGLRFAGHLPDDFTGSCIVGCFFYPLFVEDIAGAESICCSLACLSLT